MGDCPGFEGWQVRTQLDESAFYRLTEDGRALTAEGIDQALV